MTEETAAPAEETPEAAAPEAPEEAPAAVEGEAGAPEEGAEPDAGKKVRKSISELVEAGEVDEKSLSPSLRQALRVERKTKAMKAEAEQKLSVASQKERAAEQRAQQAAAQVEQWKEQVQPRLQRLEQIERAASNPAALLKLLGHDPRKFTEALADALSNPIPDEVQRELEEGRRFREDQARRDKTATEQREAQEREARAQAQDRSMVSEALEIAGEAVFPGLHRYQADPQFGLDALMSDAYAVQQQMLEAARDGKGPPVTRASLLRELEKRAAIHYKLGGAAPKSATPAQGTGRVEPGKPAAPAAPGRGTPPRSVRQATATAAAGAEHDLTPEELDRRAVARLKAARRAS